MAYVIKLSEYGSLLTNQVLNMPFEVDKEVRTIIFKQRELLKKGPALNEMMRDWLEDSE